MNSFFPRNHTHWTSSQDAVESITRIKSSGTSSIKHQILFYTNQREVRILSHAIFCPWSARYCVKFDSAPGTIAIFYNSTQFYTKIRSLGNFVLSQINCRTKSALNTLIERYWFLAQKLNSTASNRVEISFN